MLVQPSRDAKAPLPFPLDSFLTRTGHLPAHCVPAKLENKLRLLEAPEKAALHAHGPSTLDFFPIQLIDQRLEFAHAAQGSLQARALNFGILFRRHSELAAVLVLM